MTRYLDDILRWAFYLAATAFAIASAAGAQPSAPAATGVVPEQVVRSVLEGWVREQIEQEAPEEADGGTRYEIEARWQGDLMLDTPGQVDFEVKRLSSRPFRGPTVVRLVLKVGGQVVRNMSVTVDCRHYRPVVVATRSLRRHAEVDVGALEVVERDVTSLKHGWFESPDELQAMRAARPVGVGEVVGTRHVEAIPIVHRGDGVVMVLQTGNMALQAVGEALGDGGIGERIRVRNIDSQKVVFGKITGPGIVSIQGI